MRRSLSSASPLGTLVYKAGAQHSDRFAKQTALGASNLLLFTGLKFAEMANPQDFPLYNAVPGVGLALSALFLGMIKLSTRDSVSELYTNEGVFTIKTFTMTGKVGEEEIKIPAKGLALHGFGHKPNYFFIRWRDDARWVKQRILRLEKNDNTEKMFTAPKRKRQHQ
ncbi:hypothetical protein BASA81_010740 [Batrachochytrium salamandrivorans]|nr:hypothetical protein BASA81_010740 [Batrachochytrium salamandrivorans]